MTRGHMFQKELLDWFERNKRPLPWREDYAPYHVWVSEIMLQQTQMERATAYFMRWIARFPDIAAVAAAHEDEILKYWEGLGYYSRARNLHKAAQRIMAVHGGVFPESYEDIRALPGVGPYTAGAVAAIAFNAPRSAVDANVERVLSRVFDIDAPIKEGPGKRRAAALAEELLPQGRARDFTQALMEFGALVCRPKNPACPDCPIRDACEALRLGIVAERPVLRPAKAITPLHVATGVLLHKGLIFTQKRLPEGAWANLWEFPGGRIEPGETPEEAVVREFLEETGFHVALADNLGVIRHGYTTFRVTLRCFLLRLERDPAGYPEPALTAASESRWTAMAGLGDMAFPAGHRKLIDQLLHDPRFAGNGRL
jgi:A/G-specific adenine glycosylase